MNLEYYYSPDAPYVGMYSIEHIVFLLFCAAAIVLCVCFRKAIAQKRELIGKIMLGIILFQQIFLMYGWYLLTSSNLLKEALPLELCRISTLLTVVFLLKKDNRIMDVIFYFSIYALCSLIYPKNIYHFAHVNGISYMINHLMTVLTPIFGAIAYDWKPTWKSWLRASIAFSIYFPVVVIVNLLTGGNYFYLTDRPFWNGMHPVLFDSIAYAGTIAGFALATVIVHGIIRLFDRKKATV